MSFATNPTDGVRIAYTVEGEGPPLVLLHGSGGSSAFWHGLGYVEALKHDYRLVLVDARGHGRSDKPREEEAYAMERFAGDVVAVLDDLGLDRAHFVGYSLGGRVGYGLGKYAPERFASLVIGGGSYRTSPGWFDRLTFPGAVETIAAGGLEPFLAEWERRLGAPLPAGVRAMYLANDVDALVPYLRYSDREPSYEDALAGMTMPVLIFVGERDAERFEQSRLAAERLPDATFVVIPGADHAGAILRRDAVLPHVRPFLERVTRPEPALA